MQEIMSTVEILSAAIHRIQLVKQIPDDLSQLPQFETVQCSVLDLCAAIVEYLALAIKNFKSSFQSSFLVK
jgi:hypothetical protein